jgi:hypothetical protein
MKQLINYTDHEKIEAFDRIYKETQEYFLKITDPDNEPDIFIGVEILENITIDALELNKAECNSLDTAIRQSYQNQ